MSVVRVPCARIKPAPCSRGYAPHEVDALAVSIRENGMLRPIVLCETPDGYVIVHGERRWRAARLLGHATIIAWLVLDLQQQAGGAP